MLEHLAVGTDVLVKDELVPEGRAGDLGCYLDGMFPGLEHQVKGFCPLKIEGTSEPREAIRHGATLLMPGSAGL